MVMMMLGSVGGRENYYHCVMLRVLPALARGQAQVSEGSMHRECPICLDVSAAPVAISYRFWGIEY